jgi:hypothetical protein
MLTHYGRENAATDCDQAMVQLPRPTDITASTVTDADDLLFPIGWQCDIKTNYSNIFQKLYSERPREYKTIEHSKR